MYKDINKLDGYWDVNSESTGSGFYISVSGNTGAGKSTLLKLITSYLKNKNIKKIKTINERVLHHPLLQLMFKNPSEYSYLIQLNFLIQRIVLIKRWIELGYFVVIERSHLDDSLFIDHHLKKNHISAEEHSIYMSLSKNLINKHVPDPDIMILLDVDPEVSYQRICEAEENGERPKEFPNEKTKIEYIDSWSLLYIDFFKRLENEEKLKSELVRIDNNSEIAETMKTIQTKIDGRINRF